MFSNEIFDLFLKVKLKNKFILILSRSFIKIIWNII